MQLRDTVVPLCVLIIAAVALTGCFFWMRPILVPAVLSFFLFFMISPFIDWADRYLSIPKTLTMGVTLFGLGVGTFTSPIHIKIDYGYMTTISKDIKIKKHQ